MFFVLRDRGVGVDGLGVWLFSDLHIPMLLRISGIPLGCLRRCKRDVRDTSLTYNLAGISTFILRWCQCVAGSGHI